MAASSLQTYLANLRPEDIIDLSQPSLYLSVGSIIFNPLVWNIVARNEHRHRTLTKALGSPYMACYLLAICIVSAGFLRDGLFERALRAQPQTIPESDYLKAAAVALFVFGQTLVLSSTWALGVTGTYLGDYCGLLQETLVTGFPFNIQKDPMYNGSTMCFLATALWYRRPAGVLVSVIVYIVYRVALRYEGPFTGQIYADREAKREKEAKDAAYVTSGGNGASTPPKQSLGGATAAGALYASALKEEKREAPLTPGRVTRSQSRQRSEL